MINHDEERIDTMTDYVELSKQLEVQDVNIITKLAIFHELSSSIGIEEMSIEEVNEIVEYVHNIYLNNDNTDFIYPKVAYATLRVCNFSSDKLLSSIRENRKKLEEQILDILYEINLGCLNN